MKISICIIVLLVSLLFLPCSSRRIDRSRSHHGHHHSSSPSRTRQDEITNVLNNFFRDHRRPTKRRGGDAVQIAGSSLPDCSHACGSCTPCRLVMVSFVCSSLEEAETCPMAYKCMCRNKSYPVP
ncbi:protein EPIDERMAL PATTERNING FACTOR 1 [Mercurialis annua]|uniref:protein EPIDERMAL PATTERNING FACTOR 1 n=1 Tax=Mercurialis annua TaxID=3986 RepID=UPI00215FAD07|nr:protein EPIDERMAL PATTERNING FACTOR 1 [Mercurialis annua]